MKKHHNGFRRLVWIAMGVLLVISLFFRWLPSGRTSHVQASSSHQAGSNIVAVYSGTYINTTDVNTYWTNIWFYDACSVTGDAQLQLMDDGSFLFTIDKTIGGSFTDDSLTKPACAVYNLYYTFLGTYTIDPNRLVFTPGVIYEGIGTSGNLLPEKSAAGNNANDGLVLISNGEGTYTDSSAEGKVTFQKYPTANHYAFVLDLDTGSPGAPATDTPATPGAACTPHVRGLSPSKPGDKISPGADYTGPDGQGVGIIQERWFLNGVNTTSIVWDGKSVTVEHQYTCLDEIGYSRTYIIPDYQGFPVEPIDPDAEVPTFPGNLTPQDIAKVAGAILIALGGLLGIGGAAVGVGGAILGAPPAVPPAVPQPPAGQPPAPEPPGAPGGEPPPDASPGGSKPKNFVDSDIWNLIKINTSAATTIMGTLGDLWKFPDSAETLKKMRDALDVWKRTPTAANADDYLKSLDNTFGGKNPGFKKVTDYLGNLAKGVDIMDAVGAGLKKAAEKGGVGVDNTLDTVGAVGAEVIKKGITWAITKNPIIGAVDGVVGGVSQAISGKDDRIDLGAGVDKVVGGVFNEYDKATSNVGRLWEKGVTDTARSTTNIALENARRHINNQVASGKLSPASGRARISRLEKLITGEK